MKRLVLLNLLFSISLSTAFADPLPRIAIQPLGPVKPEAIAKTKAGIIALYAVTVEILPEKPLPKSAYYPPRDRYKADDILDLLAAGMPKGYSKIIALTARDISTTNDEGKDWGIFGLGQLGGSSCVVSTFRLHAGNASEKSLYARLVKIVNHELGHTFGVEHCPVPACLMQHKRGKIASVDAESGIPCATCLPRLPMIK